ncbi:hypothetical protein FLA_1415 [Filimonas lacunae]|nr:hypothetical protein FLA_1415 [Filimonas lacunae]
MKYLHAILFALIFIALLPSCKKEGDQPGAATTVKAPQGNTHSALREMKYTPQILQISQGVNSLSVALLKPKHSNILSLRYRGWDGSWLGGGAWFYDNLLSSASYPSATGLLSYTDGATDEFERVCYTYDIPFNNPTGGYDFKMDVEISNHDTNTTDYDSATYINYPFVYTSNGGAGNPSQTTLQLTISFHKGQLYVIDQNYSVLINGSVVGGGTIQADDFAVATVVTQTQLIVSSIPERTIEVAINNGQGGYWQGFFSGGGPISASVQLP